MITRIRDLVWNVIVLYKSMAWGGVWKAYKNSKTYAYMRKEKYLFRR